MIFGGTVADDRDHKLADSWFQDKYDKTLKAVDFEATTKYRFDPKFETGSTFGVNYATIGGDTLFQLPQHLRQRGGPPALHEKFVADHYLKQSTRKRSRRNSRRCAESHLAAVARAATATRRTTAYQTMGPLAGVRPAGRRNLTHHADTLVDAISIGGVVADGVSCGRPPRAGNWESASDRRSAGGFRRRGRFGAQCGSASAADAIVAAAGWPTWETGERHCPAAGATRGRSSAGSSTLRSRGGWMVPNQYWTPSVLSPIPIVGKYFMYYRTDFCRPANSAPQRRANEKELILDNMGPAASTAAGRRACCRRSWKRFTAQAALPRKS